MFTVTEQGCGYGTQHETLEEAIARVQQIENKRRIDRTGPVSVIDPDGYLIPRKSLPVSRSL
jgi:hypothetical protein